MSNGSQCLSGLCKVLNSHAKRLENMEADSSPGGGSGPDSVSTLVRLSGGNYVHSGDGESSTTIDLQPSSNSCNGIRMGSDNKHFTEDYGFTTANNWADVQSLIGSGFNVLVCTQIDCTTPATLSGGAAIMFAEGGSFQTNGNRIEINVKIINPNNHRIFFGYTINEAYNNRWFGTGSTVVGTFGGDNFRDPRWWGLTTTTDPNNGAEATADLNNDAIAAASMSARLMNSPGAQLTVTLPAGSINTKRPIRLDGIRVRLVGQGANATQIWAQSDLYDFDVSHFITTEDYPTNGATPVIELGYEIQTGIDNPDAGFHGGVEELAIICPVDQPTRRVSGVMWESGLQEQTKIAFVTVANYGGYAFGGPRQQHLVHNPDTGNPAEYGGYYTQLNSVEMHNLWIFSANKNDAIGMNVFGVNFNIHDITVDHGRENVFGGMVTPAIQTGSRGSGRWENIHIEQSTADGVTGVGIDVLNIGLPDRLTLDGITLQPSQPEPVNWTSRTIRIQNTNGGVCCSSVSNTLAWNYKGGHYAIEDVPRGKLSTGYHAIPGNSSYVAFYARDETAGVFGVQTTNPALV